VRPYLKKNIFPPPPPKKKKKRTGGVAQGVDPEFNPQYRKKKKKKKKKFTTLAGSMAQEVECLPSKRETQIQAPAQSKIIIASVLNTHYHYSLNNAA
jgi:hypothetical protein